MSNLPLPQVHDVYLTVHHDDSFVIIAYDYAAGTKERYNVIRVFYNTGRAKVIGRAIHLKDAKILACMPWGV